MSKQEIIDELQVTSFRLIRQRANSMKILEHDLTDSELGEYVRGVVDLETEIYEAIITSNDIIK